jgi:hypothetical protein
MVNKQFGLPSAYELAKFIPEKRTEKYDEQLTDDILSIGHGAKDFDINGIKTCGVRVAETCRQVCRSACLNIESALGRKPK